MYSFKQNHFFGALYYSIVAIIFFTMFHVVAIAKMHNWERELFGVPVGVIVGMSEVGLFVILAIVSIYFAYWEIKKW